MAAKFHGADVRCAGAAEEYRKVAEELGVHFYDSAQACAASDIDGIHLDGDQHARLGRALAREVPRWLLERGAGQPLPTPPPVG
jgi:hypothetical protein